MKIDKKSGLENAISKKLTRKVGGISLYIGGFPGYTGIFARDSILSCLLMNDTAGLKRILQYCIKTQGRKKDPLTGEEEGKIFHEYPGIKIRGRFTRFNASDTTALFLIGMDVYNIKKRDKFARQNLESIEKALGYILRHVKDGLFVESPEFCNADKFALKATYWKDSEVYDRKGGEPYYPVAYALLQAQAIAALRSGARLTGRGELKNVSSKLNKALWERLYDKRLKTLTSGKDKRGNFSAVTADALHSLYYLEKKDIPKKKLEEIVETSKKLETPVGYKTTYNHNKKGYHSDSIWPFEQAFIYAGAKKFKLQHVKDVASRIVEALGNDNSEYLFYNSKTGRIHKKGCNPQLWTIASKLYFLKEDK